MNTIFTVDDPENYMEKINLDELIRKKKTYTIFQLLKIMIQYLIVVHNKIKTTARQQIGLNNIVGLLFLK